MEAERQGRYLRKPLHKAAATVFPDKGDRDPWEEHLIRKVLRLHTEKRYGKGTRFRYKMISH